MSIEYQRHNAGEDHLYPEMCNIDTVSWANEVFANPQHRAILSVNTIKLHRAIFRYGLNIDEISIEKHTAEWEERYIEKEVPDQKKDQQGFKSYACAFYQFAHHPMEWDNLEELVELNSGDDYEYRPKGSEEESNILSRERIDQIGPSLPNPTSLIDSAQTERLSASD